MKYFLLRLEKQFIVEFGIFVLGKYYLMKEYTYTLCSINGNLSTQTYIHECRHVTKFAMGEIHGTALWKTVLKFRQVLEF